MQPKVAGPGSSLLRSQFLDKPQNRTNKAENKSAIDPCLLEPMHLAADLEGYEGTRAGQLRANLCSQSLLQMHSGRRQVLLQTRPPNPPLASLEGLQVTSMQLIKSCQATTPQTIRSTMPKITRFPGQVNPYSPSQVIPNVNLGPCTEPSVETQCILHFMAEKHLKV